MYHSDFVVDIAVVLATGVAFGIVVKIAEIVVEVRVVFVGFVEEVVDASAVAVSVAIGGVVAAIDDVDVAAIEQLTSR